MAEETVGTGESPGTTEQGSAPAQGTQQASPADALGAKLQGVDTSSETSGQGATDQGTPAGTDGGAPAGTQTVETPKLDPEIERYAQGKGFDVGEVAKSQAFQQSIKSQMAAEAEMNRIRATATAQPAPVAPPPAPVAPKVAPVAPGDKSPLAELRELREAAIQNQCWALGCQDEADLRSQYPNVVDNINREYERERESAISAEVEWQYKSREQKERAITTRQRLDSEVANAKAASSSNFLNARGRDPQIDVAMVKSGVAAHVEGLAKEINVPVEFLYAEPRMFSFFTKAAKAIHEMENIDKPGGLSERLRKQWEADAARRSEGMLPSSDSALPPALSFIAKAQKSGGGVSVLS
jgi:hypothetical protein